MRKDGKRAMLAINPALLGFANAIGETDLAIIADTLQRCRDDVDALAYFLEQADQRAAQAECALPDDRITCRQCANRRPFDGRCQVAGPAGEVIASFSYTPDATMKRRCEGYAPKSSDADQRSGRQRWPGLESIHD